MNRHLTGAVLAAAIFKVQHAVVPTAA